MTLLHIIKICGYQVFDFVNYVNCTHLVTKICTHHEIFLRFVAIKLLKKFSYCIEYSNIIFTEKNIYRICVYRNISYVYIHTHTHTQYMKCSRQKYLSVVFFFSFFSI